MTADDSASRRSRSQPGWTRSIPAGTGARTNAMSSASVDARAATRPRAQRFQRRLPLPAGRAGKARREGLGGHPGQQRTEDQPLLREWERCHRWMHGGIIG